MRSSLRLALILPSLAMLSFCARAHREACALSPHFQWPQSESQRCCHTSRAFGLASENYNGNKGNDVYLQAEQRAFGALSYP
mmetsp:Transcript_32093/g.53049  ORF Transcript_32093/g.53049 Transcript_32093/m.53049 type:complete len:82 (-) Transcript_32093:237-482(-)